MKPIDEITKDVIEKIKTCPEYKYRPPFGYDEEITDNDYMIVNELFKTLTLIFPAFRQAWPTQEDFQRAKREWIKAFKLAKLTDINQIKVGVDKFRLSPVPFVPSPGQFIEMCKDSNKDNYRIPYYSKMALESEEIKIRRKEFAKKHLDSLKSFLK